MNKTASIYRLLKRILIELNTQVVEHGERVAYLELMMAKGRGIEDSQHLENMMLACFAHDIGAYKTDKFLNLLKFDAANTLEHCIYGYLFMKYFSPLKDASEVFLYHHTFYKENIASPFFDEGVLIHMLDRIDVLHISCDTTEELIAHLVENKGTIFNPKDVDDFIRFNEEMHILDKFADGSYSDIVQEYFDKEKRNERLLTPIIDMLAFEVDFKSEQTVIHTVTTALICKCLGQKFGLSNTDIEDLFLAAKLHDLGKIKIPTEILEKPGRLTAEEYAVIQTHCEHTRNIAIDLFPARVVSLAYRHHERLDGSGYPNRLTEQELSLLDCILQVSDVASALLYKRSYKNALAKDKVIAILNEEKEAHKLSGTVIDMFTEHYDEIMAYTAEESREIIQNYENLQIEYREYLRKYSDLNHENDTIGGFSLEGIKATLTER